MRSSFNRVPIHRRALLVVHHPGVIRKLQRGIRKTLGDDSQVRTQVELCWLLTARARNSLFMVVVLLHRNVHHILVVGVSPYEARPCCTPTFPANASGDMKCSNALPKHHRASRAGWPVSFKGSKA